MSLPLTIKTDQTIVPATGEVERIAFMTDPVLRNLLITQCYCELSTAFAEKISGNANWCTFATWASKQAGQTIRKEDLQRSLTAMAEKEPEIQHAIRFLVTIASRLGAEKAEQLQRSAIYALLSKTADRAADAVARGNKKVFEEIAFQFSRFYARCCTDTAYVQEHIDSFNNELQKGLPPGGQEYLRRAFTCYYQALFEKDKQRQSELCFFANIQIGFHEQTRLQPEIAEALNAAFISEKEAQKIVAAQLYSKAGIFSKIWFFLRQLFGQTTLFSSAINSLSTLLQEHVRKILTEHLMTLTLPPANRLKLGNDLVAVYPDCLKTLQHPDLLSLLNEIDPTPGSLLESGATDWANLQERMHFIGELFRCFHETKTLLSPAFTREQVTVMKAGVLPSGEL
jgi:hypothetical protein